MGRLLAKNRELHEYVEANVLAGLSPDARLILEKCSPLAQVSFPQDAAFFGEGACLAQEVLTDLSVRGHLVHSSGGQVFRVHPLVREQTREGLERADPPSYQETVRDAAHHLERYGDLERAVSLYLSIGADAEASAVLHRLAVSFLNASISMAKPEWLLRLPEDLLHRDPSLLLVKGRILQAQGSFEEAAAAFRKAARHFEHTSGSEGLVQALLSEAFCLYMQGRWDDSLKVLDRAEKAGTSPAERVEILCSKGNVLLGQCRWDEAVEKWESALAAVAESERPVLEGRIFSYRTRLFYLRGNYRASVEWARRSVKAASGKVDPAYAVALNVCATALYTVGLYEEAQMRAQAAEALVRARGWAFLECPVHLTLAGIAQGEGRYGEAVKHLQSTRADTQRMGDMEAHVWAEQTLGDVCRLNRNPARAEEHHRTALALIDQHQLAVFERARALWGLGADLAVLGKDEEAAATLDQAVAMCRTWGLGGTLAQALFYQGWLKAKENKEPLAARVLAEAVDLLEGGGNVHFLLQESAVAVPILALCDRLGVGSYLSTHIVPRLPDRLRRYYIRLAYGATYPTDLALGRPIGSRFAESRAASFPEPQVEPELVERFTALTARELEILRLISLGMPNKVIAARLFITEKTIKTHTNRMYKKLGVLNRLQAVLAFQRYLRQPQERRSQD
jgi:ATP/maltotriose-dependent transcriptional regulator MalT